MFERQTIDLCLSRTTNEGWSREEMAVAERQHIRCISIQAHGSTALWCKPRSKPCYTSVGQTSMTELLVVSVEAVHIREMIGFDMVVEWQRRQGWFASVLWHERKANILRSMHKASSRTWKVPAGLVGGAALRAHYQAMITPSLLSTCEDFQVE